MKKIFIGLTCGLCALALASCGEKNNKELKKLVDGKDSDAVAEEVIDKLNTDNKISIENGVKLDFDFKASFASEDNKTLTGNANMNGSISFVENQGCQLNTTANATIIATQGEQKSTQKYNLALDGNYNVSENKVYLSTNAEAGEGENKKTDTRKLFFVIPESSSSTTDSSFELTNKALNELISQNSEELKKFVKENKDFITAEVDGDELKFTLNCNEEFIKKNSVANEEAVLKDSDIENLVLTVSVDEKFQLKSVGMNATVKTEYLGVKLTAQVEGKINVKYQANYTALTDTSSYVETDVLSLLGLADSFIPKK